MGQGWEEESWYGLLSNCVLLYLSRLCHIVAEELGADNRVYVHVKQKHLASFNNKRLCTFSQMQKFSCSQKNLGFNKKIKK
jgi:hypothetical protein